jgi:hypothetical protein
MDLEGVTRSHLVDVGTLEHGSIKSNQLNFTMNSSGCSHRAPVTNHLTQKQPHHIQ